MCFHWLHDRDAQEQLKVLWLKGMKNNADYLTKNHPPTHHLRMHLQFVLKAHIVRKIFFYRVLF